MYKTNFPYENSSDSMLWVAENELSWNVVTLRRAVLEINERLESMGIKWRRIEPNDNKRYPYNLR